MASQLFLSSAFDKVRAFRTEISTMHEALMNERDCEGNEGRVHPENYTEWLFLKGEVEELKTELDRVTDAIV